MLKNTLNAYGSIAKFFHWLIAILILCMLCVGFFMEDFPKDMQPLVYNIHKLTGLTILFLMILRALWAMANVKPKTPATPVEWFLERVVHYTLYILVIAMPLAGWIGSSSGGRPPHLGSLKIGLPIAKNEPLIDTMFDLHNTLAYIIIALLCVHVLAALFHHFIRKDEVLRRMMPNSVR